ncbi:O-antigen ligase family protein [Calycomorphotria hydatis]|uniref:O-Antigen ligase n=1 Tax=Calycomorphotria hydatis TaxID=2528027 RepID=A0A517TCI9_9PLAN|nr:O-antigen ligase family protein [Calycomorphotria hydatis]QDT66094.1 O-Antigen ligase [Calycomorphotria hydatis]
MAANSRKSVSSTTAEPAAGTAGDSKWAIIWIFLATARFLIPTEGAFQGDTLWIVQLSLIATACAEWVFRNASEDKKCRRFDFVDACLLVLVVGHLLSTLGVFWDGGDRRVAVNITWEWCGLWAMWRLGRIAIAALPASYQSSTEELRRWFVALTFALAMLGLWQHFVFYPQTAAHYDSLRQQETELPAGSQELRDVKRELAQMGVPPDPRARQLWENRLRASTEPFGPYALANTFGGHLTYGLLLMVPWGWWCIRKEASWSFRATIFITGAAIAYCLLLTKSRTAWVGLIVGACILAGAEMLKQRMAAQDRKRLLTIAGICLAVVVAAVVIAGISGGLDAEVLAEAPKSLTVRLQYWEASWHILSQRPLLGTGPGNFRSYYVTAKSPVASEEIAAPHNWIFDIWASGGLISLFAMLGLVFGLLRLLLNDVEETAAQPSESTSSRWPAYGTGLAIVFILVSGLLFANGLDWRMLGVAMSFFISWVLLGRESVRLSSLAQFSFVAAAIALLTHMLGADGIEFPAVVLLILLTFLCVPAREQASWEQRVGSFLPHWLAAVLFLILSAGCLFLAVLPVLNSRGLLAEARGMLAEGMGPERALSVIDEAEAADPLALEPRREGAQLASMLVMRRPRASNSAFQDAVSRWEDYLGLSPRSAAGWEELARLKLWKHEQSEQQQWAEEAVESYRRAIDLYPTDSRLRGSFALVLAELKLENEAAIEAEAALRQNEINLEYGHTDRLLDDKILAELGEIASRRLESRSVDGKQ